MRRFVDKKGHEILIEILSEDASAYHNGKKIGNILTTGPQNIDDRIPPLPAEITGLDVSEEYRRAGIATEMIRLLSEELGMLLPGRHNIGVGNHNALTDDGEALTAHCQKLGYISAFSDE